MLPMMLSQRPARRHRGFDMFRKTSSLQRLIKDMKAAPIEDKLKLALAWRRSEGVQGCKAAAEITVFSSFIGLCHSSFLDAHSEDIENTLC